MEQFALWLLTVDILARNTLIYMLIKYMCVCACMYVCINMCTYVYIHVYVCIIYMYRCVLCTCMCICVRIYTYTCTDTYICIPIYTHTNIYRNRDHIQLLYPVLILIATIMKNFYNLLSTYYIPRMPLKTLGDQTYSHI